VAIFGLIDYIIFAVCSVLLKKTRLPGAAK